MMNKLQFLASMFSMLAGFVLFGQTDERVTIIGSYEPSIRKGPKIKFEPKPPEINNELANFEWQPLQKPIQPDAQLTVIQPLLKNVNLKYPKYRTLIKAGLGSRVSPLLELTHSGGDRNKHYGIQLKHLSTWTDIPDYAPSSFTDSRLKISGRRVFRLHSLKGSLYGKYQTNKYYGFKPDRVPEIGWENSDIQQAYTLAGTNGKFGSHYTRKGKLNYETVWDVYYWSDRFERAEAGGSLSLDFNKNFEQTSLSGEVITGISTDLQYMNQQDTLSGQTELIQHITPYLRLDDEAFYLKIGLNLALGYSNTSGLFVFPLLDAHLNLLDGSLQVFTALSGGLKLNRMRDISEENPFQLFQYPAGLMNEKVAFKAGLRGNVQSKFNYQLNVSYDVIDNQYFYVTDTSAFFNPFLLEFDQMSRLGLHLSGAYLLSDQLQLQASFSFFNYNLKNEPHAWQMPPWLFDFRALYQFNESVAVNLALRSFGSRFAKQYTGSGIEEVSMDAVYDVHAGVEIMIIEELLLFAEADNLLAQSYQQWYLFPVQSIQLFAGVKWRIK